MHSILLSLICCLAIFSSSQIHAQERVWDNRFSLDYSLRGIHNFCATDSGILAVGDFFAFGKTTSGGIVSWDGTAWKNIASSLLFAVNAQSSCTDSSGSLYVIGTVSLKTGDRLPSTVQIRGNTIQPIDNPPDIAFYNNRYLFGGWSSTLYAAGSDGNVYVLRNGWESIGQFCIYDTGICQVDNAYPFHSVLPVGDSMYVAGRFSTVNGVPAGGLALYDGTAWRALPKLRSSFIRFLSYVDGKLYVAGRVVTDDSTVFADGAIFDGSNWQSFDPNGQHSKYRIGQNSRTFVRAGSRLYTSSQIVDSSGKVIASLGYFDGTSWQPLEQAGANEYMFEWRGDLYVPTGNRLLVLRDDTLLAVGMQGPNLGLPGTVRALTVYKDSLVAACTYSSPSNPFKDVGILGSEGWQPTLLQYENHAEGYNRVAATSDVLYFGGRFRHYGGMLVQNVMQYRDGMWSPLGLGLGNSYDPDDNLVWDIHLYTHGDDLYVSGDFDSAGGSHTGGLAHWNGSAWQLYDTTYWANCKAMLMYRDTLLLSRIVDRNAGKTYNLGTAVNSTISPRGAGANGEIHAIAQYKNGFLIAGYFTEVDGIPARGIAYWNGNAWESLDSGVPPRIYALAVNGETIYAAGSEVLCVWENGKWAPLMQNVKNWEYHALQIHHDLLYIGGRFFSMDTVASSNIAALRIVPVASVTPKRRSSASIAVTPNPARDYLHVEVQDDIVTTIELVDLLGRTVLRSQGTTTLQVHSLPAGRYMALVTGMQGIYSLPVELVR